MPADTSSDFPALPDGFRLGASTASYQIEGAVAEDGRGRSIWDTFCDRPGAIVDQSSGEVACDHYHRYHDDVALMRELGVHGYRFSVAWSRIQPEGTGRANAAGLAFYDRLVDELLAAGISPMATLFHWDLPQALQDAGGWLDRATAERFGEYAALVALKLGDRVEHWCPVNEPNVHTIIGHATGVHAPGLTLGLDALPVAHHLLLGHGRAVAALRAAGARQVGSANNHAPVRPASDDPADQAAAGLYDSVWNRLFSDSMLLGRYPDGISELMPAPAGGDLADDLAAISAPLDFYGLNYYFPVSVADPASPLAGEERTGLPVKMIEVASDERTEMGWPVVPDGLRELLVGMHATYGDRLPPVFITENGVALPDVVEQGACDDPRRIAYLDSHLRAIAAAVDEGVDVAGYYTWSMMDNFEWAEGLTKRFGLVHVDYDTLERTPKTSYGWYRDLIAAQAR